MAFAHNVFYGNPLRFGFIGWNAWKYPERTSTIERWRRWLHKHKCIESSTGIITHKSPVKNPSAHDFRLIKHSPAIDRGIKYFVPWGLYAVVGEWHFIPHPADISLIIGENINMNEEYFHRSMFQYIPRNHLHARNITENSFIHGTLENWTRGALSFDGESSTACFPIVS